jgi:GINS complex subunit 1
MSAERAVELIKELQRKPDTLPPYNMDGVRQVYDEIRTMAELNARDVQVR